MRNLPISVGVTMSTSHLLISFFILIMSCTTHQEPESKAKGPAGELPEHIAQELKWMKERQEDPKTRIEGLKEIRIGICSGWYIKYLNIVLDPETPVPSGLDSGIMLVFADQAHLEQIARSIYVLGSSVKFLNPKTDKYETMYICPVLPDWEYLKPRWNTPGYLFETPVPEK